jgi:2-polyprenyl-6-methoxyphenol hydroxylase-like FAD-dependent oxidoreductase
VESRRDGALYEPSRPLLESVVLGRVRALPNVETLDGYDVEGVTADGRGNRVTGPRVTSRGERPVTRELPADLVVSATGRSGRAAAWLKDLGYAAPAEEQVPVDIMYVTQRLRLPPEDYDGKRAVLAGVRPERPQGAGAFAQEHGTWVVTLFGYGGHHPPMDRPGWLDLADAVLPREFARAVRGAEPLGELIPHRFPANLRRRYDRLDRFPEGFLVTGDALCSFNPVYGQGMTVAALEALAMRAALAQGEEHLAQRFFRTAAKPISDAWRFAVGGDLALPTAVVPGPRPLPGRAVNAYIDRFQAAAENDPVMAWRFLDVTGFEQPSSALFSGDSLRRMTTSGRRAPVGATS